MSTLVTDVGPSVEGGAGEVAVAFEATATLVSLVGDVDLVHGRELTAVAEDAIERGLPVRIDVSRLTFLDSTAIGFFAAMVRTGREQGWRLLVVGATRMVLETLTLAGLQHEVDLVRRS
jgi:anti-anti-sigma factor